MCHSLAMKALSLIIIGSLLPRLISRTLRIPRALLGHYGPLCLNQVSCFQDTVPQDHEIHDRFVCYIRFLASQGDFQDD